MKLRLFGIGSDPEYLIGNIRDWEVAAVNAGEILGTGAAQNLPGFIGVDGHNATAELRPPPARNIRKHLHSVAVALVTVQDYLNGRHPPLAMFASPTVANEPLGGHIHTSFYVTNDPLLDGAIALGRVEGVDQALIEWPRYGVPPPDYTHAKYLQATACGESFGVATYARTMGYLLESFERGIQPQVHRETRNQRYGRPDDVRIGDTQHNTAPANRGHYFHLEYRAPSTWLQHPWVAYIYLALAKLTLLNFGLIAVRTGDKIHPLPSLEYRDQFIERLRGVLATPTLRISRDLRGLSDTTAKLFANREAIMRPNTPINVKAWRKMLGG